MSYVVMKRLGDRVALVSERVFASRQEALQELGTALAGTGDDSDAEYVVFDVGAASPVLLLPVEVDEAAASETPEAAWADEVVFEEPTYLVESEESLGAEPADTIVVEVVAADPVEPLLEEVLLPKVLVEDIVVGDVIVEELVESGLVEGLRPAPDEELAADQGPVEAEASGHEPESGDPDAVITPEEPAEAETEDVAVSEPLIEEPGPEIDNVNHQLDELLPLVELSMQDEPEVEEELVETAVAQSDLQPSPGPQPRMEPAGEPEPELVADAGPEPSSGPESVGYRLSETEDVPEPESGPGSESVAVLDPEPEPEPVMPGYAAGESDLQTLTCEDCVYVTTCPNKEDRTPSACGSFQWVSV